MPQHGSSMLYSTAPQLPADMLPSFDVCMCNSPCVAKLHVHPVSSSRWYPLQQQKSPPAEMLSTPAATAFSPCLCSNLVTVCFASRVPVFVSCTCISRGHTTLTAAPTCCHCFCCCLAGLKTRCICLHNLAIFNVFNGGFSGARLLAMLALVGCMLLVLLSRMTAITAGAGRRLCKVMTISVIAISVSIRYVSITDHAGTDLERGRPNKGAQRSSCKGSPPSLHAVLVLNVVAGTVVPNDIAAVDVEAEQQASPLNAVPMVCAWKCCFAYL